MENEINADKRLDYEKTQQLTVEKNVVTAVHTEEEDNAAENQSR